MSKPKLLALLAIAATLVAVSIIYGLGLHNGLVFDDNRLTDGTIYGQFGSLAKLQVRMLSYGSFVWVNALFGDSIAIQRIVNVLLHLCTCYSIWLLVTELFKYVQFSPETTADPAFAGNQRIAIFAAVALFAVHPMAVYAVGYLVQRSMVMLTLFSALACWSYLKALDKSSWAWGAAALLCTLMAFLSKEHAVVLPALALPLYIFARRPRWKSIAAISAGVLVSAGLLTLLLWSRLGAIVGAVATDDTSWAYVHQLEALYPGIKSSIYPLSLLNQAALFIHYGWLWLVPNVQWMAIDLRPTFPLTFMSGLHLAGALLFAGLCIAGAALLLRKRNAWGLVGLVLVCTALLFSTEFVTAWLQDPFVLYRSYLWAMMLPALVALVLVLFPRKAMVAFACVAGIAFTALAIERNLTFKNTYTVWDDAAQKIDLQAPFNAFGRWRPYINRGAFSLENLNYEQALQDFERAAALQEPLGSAQFNRGMTLEMLKRYAEAIAAFDAAEKLGFKNAALAYHQAVSYKALRQLEPAYQSYAKALAWQPDPALQSKILLEQAEVAVPGGHYETAIANYQQLLQGAPGNTRYEIGLGIALIGQKNYEKALQIFNASLARQANPPAFYGKALVFREKGDMASAIDNMEKASQMDPANPVYRNLLSQLKAASR